MSDSLKNLSPSVSINLLKKHYAKGKFLLKTRPLNEDDYVSWENIAREYLVKAFGPDSSNINLVLDIGKHGLFPVSTTDKYLEEIRFKNLEKKLNMLDSLIELLQAAIGDSQKVKSKAETKFKRDTVFLVHGHNYGIKEAVARFLEKLDLKVTVLHEKPNLGRTIIEKFVDYSDVAFAVVLLTGDDRGGNLEMTYEKQSPRARQNVILELGFFLGKLGRKRVCALYQDGIEIPSDYQGVLFLMLDDAGAWKIQLARELKAAGLTVDMNKAM